MLPRCVIALRAIRLASHSIDPNVSPHQLYYEYDEDDSSGLYAEQH